MIDKARLTKVTQSSEWNLGRLDNILAIIAGDEPNIPCVDGWYRVSRHAAGMDSAYVVQHKLRRRHPMLDTKVVNTSTDTKVKWNAEIWVKLKTGASDDRANQQVETCRTEEESAHGDTA